MMTQGTWSFRCPWVSHDLHPVSPIFESTANVAHEGSSAEFLTGGATAGAELTQGSEFGGAPPATVGWPFTEVIAAPVTPVRPACKDSNAAALQGRALISKASGTLEGRCFRVQQCGRSSWKTFQYHSVWHTGRQIFSWTAMWPLFRKDLSLAKHLAHWKADTAFDSKKLCYFLLRWVAAPIA